MFGCKGSVPVVHVVLVVGITHCSHRAMFPAYQRLERTRAGDNVRFGSSLATVDCGEVGHCGEPGHCCGDVEHQMLRVLNCTSAL